jgi:hypothetical protein
MLGRERGTHPEHLAIKEPPHWRIDIIYSLRVRSTTRESTLVPPGGEQDS